MRFRTNPEFNSGFVRKNQPHIFGKRFFESPNHTQIKINCYAAHPAGAFAFIAFTADK
jgi:hypothetical protein